MVDNDNLTNDMIPYVEFADNANERTPCVLVLDCSGSMRGEPIKQLNAGLKALEKELKEVQKKWFHGKEKKELEQKISGKQQELSKSKDTLSQIPRMNSDRIISTGQRIKLCGLTILYRLSKFNRHPMCMYIENIHRLLRNRIVS